MNTKSLKLMRKQISQKVETIRNSLESTHGIDSWIKYMRKALNMSGKQLAKRVNISISTVYQTERKEKDGAITISNLRKMAEAMDCHLVYAMVPKKPLEDIVTLQAKKMAVSIVTETSLNMELEDQGLSKNQREDHYQELVEELKYSKQLWD